MYMKWIAATLICIGISTMLYFSQQLRRQYKGEAAKGLKRTSKLNKEILNKADIAHLPDPVQKYLEYVGVLGHEKVNSFRVVMNGSMKADKDKDWAKVKVEQHSFQNEMTRLFFINMNMAGVPVIGLHSYMNAQATMLVKVAGLFPVVDGKGKEMDQGETVTFFNDMCFLAPATLIDDRISWQVIDDFTVKGTFENEGLKISAQLYFNEKGQLINFISEDRYFSPTGETYEKVRWSTPISDYKSINGFNLPTYGEAVWHFPEGDFCYAKFNVTATRYNL